MWGRGTVLLAAGLAPQGPKPTGIGTFTSAQARCVCRALKSDLPRHLEPRISPGDTYRDEAPGPPVARALRRDGADSPEIVCRPPGVSTIAQAIQAPNLDKTNNESVSVAGFNRNSDARRPTKVSCRSVSSTHAAERLGVLANQHSKEIERFLFRLGVPQSELDDVTQHALIGMARHLDEVEHGCERSYLFGIANKVALHERRTRARRQRTQRAYAEYAPWSVATPSFDERSHAREIIDKTLAKLPEPFRSVLVLFELEQLSIDQVAEALQVPVGTVGSRLRRARLLFRRLASEAA